MSKKATLKKRASGALKRQYHMPMPDNKIGKRLSTKVRLPKFIKKIGTYFREAFRELKKVIWPSRKETWRLTAVVIIFTVIFSAFLTAVDIGFEQLAKRIFL